MKVKLWVERECCQTDDLKPYGGAIEEVAKRFSPMFCVHCGQAWVWDRNDVHQKVVIKDQGW